VDLIPTTVETHALCEAPCEGTGGPLEEFGVHGKNLDSLFTHEGTYSFRAVASYDDGTCSGQRETAWSVNVGVGIISDPSKTLVETIIGDASVVSATEVTLRVTPRDLFGNNLGPGRCEAFEARPYNGTSITGACTDNLDGTYTFEVIWDQTWSDADPYHPPGFEIVQPDRRWDIEVNIEAAPGDLPEMPPPTTSCPLPAPPECGNFLFVFGTTLLHGSLFSAGCYNTCVFWLVAWFYKWFLGYGPCPVDC